MKKLIKQILISPGSLQRSRKDVTEMRRNKEVTNIQKENVSKLFHQCEQQLNLIFLVINHHAMRICLQRRKFHHPDDFTLIAPATVEKPT